jgi:hypothetical protein
VERARRVERDGLFGHHTHFGGGTIARPPDPAVAADRVRRERWWLNDRGLKPRFFCGGGWLLDRPVAAAVAEANYVDCTALSSVPSYIIAAMPYLSATEPCVLILDDGQQLTELPATHSLGMASRSLLGARRVRPSRVHLYFYDWDLLDRRRAAALRVTLRVLCRRYRPLAIRELDPTVTNGWPKLAGTRRLAPVRTGKRGRCDRPTSAEWISTRRATTTWKSRRQPGRLNFLYGRASLPARNATARPAIEEAALTANGWALTAPPRALPDLPVGRAANSPPRPCRFRQVAPESSRLTCSPCARSHYACRNAGTCQRVGLPPPAVTLRLTESTARPDDLLTGCSDVLALTDGELDAREHWPRRVRVHGGLSGRRAHELQRRLREDQLERELPTATLGARSP